MKFETYNIAQGKIMIAFSDKNLSVGLLLLNSNQELEKHNRPVLEQLYQVKGTSVMRLFNEDGITKEVTLKEGDNLEIPANQFHQHTNPSGSESITLWKFEGDITEIIEAIRKSAEM